MNIIRRGFINDWHTIHITYYCMFYFYYLLCIMYYVLPVLLFIVMIVINGY